MKANIYLDTPQWVVLKSALQDQTKRLELYKELQDGGRATAKIDAHVSFLRKSNYHVASELQSFNYLFN